MIKTKLIQKNFRFTQKELDMLAWLSEQSGVNSESPYLRSLINRTYKEEKGFLEYMDQKQNDKG